MTGFRLFNIVIVRTLINADMRALHDRKASVVGMPASSSWEYICTKHEAYKVASFRENQE
jgi:hypothetical protein